MSAAVAAARSPFGTLALAATAASVGVVVIETGGVLAEPDAWAAIVVWSTVGLVAGGVYVKSWRPGNPLGTLLVVSGFLTALYALQGSSVPALFGLGLLVDTPGALLLFYVMLAYPSARLSRVGRIAFGLSVAFFALVFIPRQLVTSPISGASSLAACAAPCANPLQIVDNERLAEILSNVTPVARLITIGGVAVALGYELAVASRPRRRTLFPVAAIGILWVSLLAVLGTIQTYASPEVAKGLGYGVATARAMLPAAFLLAPLQARAFSGLALQRMLHRFERARTLLARERVIAQTLDDPRLRIGFWLPLSHQYVDATGIVVERPGPRSGLAWTPIRRAGEPFVVLVHDEALSDDPELVRAAGHALVLTVGSRQIEADLERSVSELERSRRQLLEADAADRRRLERELHATAQQHLVALRVGLELTRERAEANTALASRLAALGGELDQAVDDIRRIAADIYSPLLEQAGLAAALRDAARRAREPLQLEVEDVGRLPPEMESCLYFCIVEAMSNALAHGGAPPRVRLARENGELTFSVFDSGVGFDVEQAPRGGGLQGISERIAAVGGSADIVSVPGRGTVVSGRVPLTGAPALGREEIET